MSVKPKKVRLLQLYPHQMNIYGDRGNALAIIKRLEWHGYQPELVYHHPGGQFPDQVDLVIGGGGQDSGQEKVQSDLQLIGPELHRLAEDGVPMLMICGLYQLFGRFFKTAEGKIIKGIGLLAAETHAGPKRLIGNILINSDFGEIIGYENHSGQTFLDDPSQALGTVIKGAGNNGADKTEGARYQNVIGSYLHGSLLPKNPILADWLIERAVTRRFGEFGGNVIDDGFAHAARRAAKARPR
ncbi:MAG: glutamine amidotransferase [Candidatus Chaera renei]|uniref:Lipid II isoglutaminyl synthase (glutamine-hydrolyzing) subunit GatD n=1 Tax=Candidatus Chaera renei TaxID=2506947 RepID=A0A4V1J7P7_9BACT|nr:MAG: glutamine amidotransferase [Candidatus Chaera renei]